MATPTVFPADSCHECDRQAAARCPTCRHGLCMDHFPLPEHQPCATHLVHHADRYICYVCGTAVLPQQWSTALFAHYVDAQRCAGCGRFVCDARHTHWRADGLRIMRDGLRTNRYHVTLRYCAVCAPVRRLGGLVGASWWAVGLATVGAAAFFLFQR